MMMRRAGRVVCRHLLFFCLHHPALGNVSGSLELTGQIWMSDLASVLLRVVNAGVVSVLLLGRVWRCNAVRSDGGWRFSLSQFLVCEGQSDESRAAES